MYDNRDCLARKFSQKVVPEVALGLDGQGEPSRPHQLVRATLEVLRPQRAVQSRSDSERKAHITGLESLLIAPDGCGCRHLLSLSARSVQT